MSNVFVGNNIVGNFTSKGEIQHEISAYSIDKINRSLCLINGKEQIELEPLDDNARLVVSNFSDEVGEFNESIYRVEENKGIIIIILYVYSGVQRLLLDSQQINIHLKRDAEKQICGDGFGDFHLDSPKEIVPFLTDIFINNSSIFVHLEPKNKESFQMFGSKYRANVRMERPGVYFIDRIYKTYNKEYSFSLTQLYGNIKFILWSESTTIAGNPSARLEAVQTNEVFKAWDEYMDFEQRIYENDLANHGMISYTKIIAKGEQLIFEVSENATVSAEDLKTHEFEFISSFTHDGERSLPENITELIRLKQDSKEAKPVFLGKCQNDDYSGTQLVFDLPYKGFFMDLCPHKGLLYISDHSLRVEQKRRKKVLGFIESKKNESSNIIMKLSAADVIDDQLAGTYKPINAEVLKKMFGNPNFEVKETFREALSIALNTPDIALIQGPPGTGKTTLITGLIARLNMMSKNYKILVSSEQHEALYNVVGKLSTNKLIPPFVSSKQFGGGEDDDDSERFESNIRTFQQSFLAVCSDLLRDKKSKSTKSARITELVYLIQTIRENNYSKNYINSIIDQIKEKTIELGYYDDLAGLLSQLIVSDPTKAERFANEEADYVSKAIIRKIESQRIDVDVFLGDDGTRQYRDLQKLLKTNGYDEFLFDEQYGIKLTDEDEAKVREVFPLYVEYVDTLRWKFMPHEFNEFEDTQEEDCRDVVEKLSLEIYKLSSTGPKDFYDIIESLSYRLNDIDSAAEIVKEYTSVIGSTCAQADRSIGMVDLTNDRYDYVIIDEAARANPLDIMIPMMLGTKVILIGDHKQLPHYIESNYVSKFKKEKNLYSEFDENLLTKSLFQIIYENLEKAYKEGRTKCKRTIQIDEQHRMNPIIGQFISDEFYDGTISNGEKTLNKINDYNVYNKKNVVWINVPIFKGTEEKANQSLMRIAEVERIKDVVKKLVSKNPGRRLEIGIISFYKGQVEAINAMLRENFPQNVLEGISCNTVDSYQGKEFDIVIVSGVRSNTYSTPEKSLGFIHHSASRINVALSRAKKLLIMVGDADTYNKNEHFHNFIKYVKENGYYE